MHRLRRPRSPRGPLRTKLLRPIAPLAHRRALSQVMPLGDPAELREHIAPDQLLAAVGGEDEYEFDPDDRPEPWLR